MKPGKRRKVAPQGRFIERPDSIAALHLLSSCRFFDQRNRALLINYKRTPIVNRSLPVLPFETTPEER
jgi:hypothetical protein